MNKKERKTKNSFVNSNTNNQLLTSKSGITLIALILTIIILLILAMVSISYIMRENIIKHAETAVDQYQIEAEKEAISLAYMEWVMYNDEQGDLNVGEDAKVTDHQNEDGNNNGWNVKFENSGNEYIVDKYGNITGPKTGGSLVGGGTDSGDGGEEQGDEPQDLISILSDARQNNQEEIDWDGDGDGEDEKWLILKNTDTSAQIVSKNVMGSLTLGQECKWKIWDEESSDWKEESLDWNKQDIKDEADVINGQDGELSNEEKALYSYNHCIEIINKYCDDLINQPLKSTVCSLGVTIENDTKNLYTSSNLKKLCSGEYDGKGRESIDGDETQPWKEMSSEQKKTNKSYWFATRKIFESTLVTFNGYIKFENGERGISQELLTIREKEGQGLSVTYPVRPVVTIPISE